MLIDQIKKISNNHKHNERERYLSIIMILNTHLLNKQVIFYAIDMDSIYVFDYIIRENIFYPYIRSPDKYTPLILAVNNNRTEYVDKILNAYSILEKDITNELPSKRSYIEEFRYYSDMRPINIAIQNNNSEMLTILISHLKTWRSENNDHTLHTETDETNSTYLHNLLMTDPFDTFNDSDIKYLIRYTDLNQVNYMGDTSAILIFKRGYWKLDIIQKELYHRKIDLLKVDSQNKNIYSYIDKHDRADFMKFVSKIILSPNTCEKTEIGKEIVEMEKIIDVLTYEELVNRKDYGLFNPSIYTYILLVHFLRTKHQNLFIPQRVYDSDLKKINNT